MPRIGLPANGKPAGASRSPATSWSARAVLRLAVAALAFRAISALVSMFLGRAFVKPAVAVDTTSSSFGLYPWLSQELGSVAGRLIPAPATPELVMAWLAFAGAMVMLALTARLDVDEERAEAAASLAAVFPFAFIFGRANADALFLLFALAAFYGFRKGQWIVGGICGAVATATLPAGILMLPALAWTGWRSATGSRVRVVIALLISACGFLGYLTYLYYVGGPSRGWAAAMGDWGFVFRATPWTPIRELFVSPLAPLDAMNVLMAVTFLIAVPVVWWRFDGGYALYMLAMLWLPLTSGKFDGLGRACTLLFPVFIFVAGVRWRLLTTAVGVASAMFYALVLALTM